MARMIGHGERVIGYEKSKVKKGKTVMRLEVSKQYTVESLSDAIELTIRECGEKQFSIFEDIRKHLEKCGLPAPKSFPNFNRSVNNRSSNLYVGAETLFALMMLSRQRWILDYLMKAAGYDVEFESRPPLNASTPITFLPAAAGHNKRGNK